RRADLRQARRPNACPRGRDRLPRRAARRLEESLQRLVHVVTADRQRRRGGDERTAWARRHDDDASTPGLLPVARLRAQEPCSVPARLLEALARDQHPVEELWHGVEDDQR